MSAPRFGTFQRSPGGLFIRSFYTRQKRRRRRALPAQSMTRNAVAAGVSRLKLLPRRKNERTHVRCYD
jgi:hypothetical protein